MLGSSNTNVNTSGWTLSNWFSDNLEHLVSLETEYKDMNIELTLNHPRNAWFKRASSEAREKKYEEFFQLLFDHYREGIIGLKYSFEKCKDGSDHMHAHIQFRFKEFKHPCALVCHLVRLWLLLLPQRYCIPNDREYNFKYMRIRRPSIVCQFVDPDEKKRTQDWEAYINKSSPSIEKCPVEVRDPTTWDGH